jgi:hypothetical protein
MCLHLAKVVENGENIDFIVRMVAPLDAAAFGGSIREPRHGWQEALNGAFDVGKRGVRGQMIPLASELFETMGGDHRRRGAEVIRRVLERVRDAFCRRPFVAFERVANFSHPLRQLWESNLRQLAKQLPIASRPRECHARVERTGVVKDRRIHSTASVLRILG